MARRVHSGLGVNRAGLIVSGLVVLAACDAAPAVPSAPAAIRVGADAVRVLDSGHWRNFLACSAGCYWNESFWVNLAVRNDAFDKQVAIVWSDNGWASSHTAYATYEAPLEGGFERWGLDVSLGTFGSAPGAPPSPREVVYAAYVRMAGQTTWEPYNDHYVYGRVTEDDPVRLLSSGVDYEAGTGAVLFGAVRVFDLAYDKRVVVRYSTDDWASWHETDASWSRGDDWEFRVSGLGRDVLPEQVVFALRYEVAGQTYWDNADGADYRHRLAPAWGFSAPGSVFAPYNLSQPVSGILSVAATPRTDIPIASGQSRADADPWRDGLSLTLLTEGLADGPHEVGFRVFLNGGFQATAKLPFIVQNRIHPQAVWEPPFKSYAPDESRGSSWGIAIDAAGRVHLQWEEARAYPEEPYRGIARFESLTDATPTLLEAFPTLPTGYQPQIWDIAIDASGRVYGLENNPGRALWRWTAAGRIDRSFGVNGRLELERSFGDHRFDVPRSVTVGGDSLWIVGTCFRYGSDCRDSINRFSLSGALLGYAELPRISTTSAASRPDPRRATTTSRACGCCRAATWFASPTICRSSRPRCCPTA